MRPNEPFKGTPGVFGSRENGWELGSTCNYFRGAGGKLIVSFGDLGSPDKSKKKKGKASILFDSLKFLLLLLPDRPSKF